MPHAEQSPPIAGIGGNLQIGPYEVLSRLAIGGMAELLLARRHGIEGFQKLVALKRILPQYATSPDFVEMFLHEARLAAALEHPNIVQVFDIGKSGDDYYFAMAYLHGKDGLAILRELARTRARMSIEHAIAIASGIAAGLHHAHEQIGFDGRPLGIVHRDVSPANAIVTFDGTVKLVDFGIAKAAAQVSHTRAGVRKGKAAYMSPEQCRGDELDRRTDIWSLGVVLYELFTMTRLFRADNDLATMHRIVSTDAPSPRAACPELPASLEAIVMRCLRRDREERYATCAALQRDLDTAAHAFGLRPSAAGLSELLRGLFGAPPLPWAPAAADSSANAPVTHSVEVGAEPFLADGAEVDSTRDLGATPPPHLDTRVAQRTSPYASVAAASRSSADRATAGGSTPARSGTGSGAPATGASVSGASGIGADAARSTVAGATAGPGRTIAVALVAVVAAGGFAWWLWPVQDPRPGAATTVPSRAGVAPPHPAPAPEPAAAAAPIPVIPTNDDAIEAWLDAVNRDDAAANPVAERHALLAKLRATDAALRIDEAVQVRLDLVQAGGAARPCETFATALARAALSPEEFSAALDAAQLPDPALDPHAGRPPDRSCVDLRARLAAARLAAAPEPAAPEPAAPVVPPEPAAPVVPPAPAPPSPGEEPDPEQAGVRPSPRRREKVRSDRGEIFMRQRTMRLF